MRLKIAISLRHWLNKLICFILGHLTVSREAVWDMQRAFLPPEVEAVCIRCWHRHTLKADLANNILTPSPLFRKLQPESSRGGKMSKICFVGDVHGHVQAFLHIIANSKVPVFQLGDMGLGFNGVNLPKLAQEHRFIRGNHDGPQACREHANYAGDYGYDPELGLFYLGGAYSIDYAWRKARMAQGGMYSANSGKLWWPDEELSELELDRALYLYDKYKPRVVATHECPANIAKLLLNYLGGGLYASAKADCMDSRTSKWLERMLQLHQPDFWVFGHYHADWKVKVGPTLFKCCAELSKFELDLP